jgi:hypothetical protein
MTKPARTAELEDKPIVREEELHYEPEVYDPAALWRAAKEALTEFGRRVQEKARTTPEEVPAQFREQHPTATRVLNVLSAPLRALAETPTGRFLTRTAEEATGAMFMTEPPQRTPLESPKAEATAKVLGTLLGSTVPVGGAFATGGRLAEALARRIAATRLTPPAAHLTTRAARGLGAGAAYAAAEEAVSPERTALPGHLATVAGFAAGEAGVAAAPRALRAGRAAAVRALEAARERLAALRSAPEIAEPAPGVRTVVQKHLVEVAPWPKTVREQAMPELPPDVESVLQATRPAADVQERLREAARRGKKSLYEILVWEPQLADYPAFREAVRRWVDVGQDANAWALRALAGVTGDLRGPEEYALFRRLVALKNFEEDLERGLEVPGGLTLEQVRAAVERLERNAPSTVTRAAERHFELMREIRNDLVRRGKLEPGQGKEYYYPHRVLEYAERLEHLPGASRLKAPARLYTRQRTGTDKLIDQDYLRVMHSHLTRVFLDNAMDDFAEQVAREWDALPHLPKELREGLRPGARVTLTRDQLPADMAARIHPRKSEVTFVAWQYEPGRQVYPATTATERTLQRALQEAAEEGVEAGREVLEAGTREVPALGRYRKIYLLPEEIAERLTRLREPEPQGHLLNAARALTRLWKRTVLGPLGAGIPFQVNNFIGDTINLFRDDPKALAYLGRAWRLAGKYQRHFLDPARLAPGERELVELATRHRVLQSLPEFLARGGDPVREAPELARLYGEDWWRKANPFRRLGEAYWSLGARREAAVRLAKFMADVNRIRRGEMPAVRVFDAGELRRLGLSAEEIAGKAARTILVDYQAVSPEARYFLRDLLFPFWTFYAHNFANWFNYVRRNPGDATLKFGLPLLAAWLWNNVRYPDVERNLPTWLKVTPHIVTGWKTGDGKPVVLGLQTPLDMAARMIGMDRMPAELGAALRGDKSLERALLDLLFPETPLAGHVRLPAPVAAALENLVRLLTPFLKAPLEAVAGFELETGRIIVPARLEDTPEAAARKARHVAEELVAPYGQYVRAARQPGEEKNLLRWLIRGPLDIVRALGIRTVDVEKARRAAAWERIERVEAAGKQARFVHERLFVRAMTTGDPALLRQAQRQIPPKTWTQLMRNPRVMAEVYEGRAAREKDPARRRTLELLAKQARIQQVLDAAKALPPEQRARVLQELFANQKAPAGR